MTDDDTDSPAPADSLALAPTDTTPIPTPIVTAERESDPVNPMVPLYRAVEILRPGYPATPLTGYEHDSPDEAIKAGKRWLSIYRDQTAK
jgi:hypothetical protein